MQSLLGKTLRNVDIAMHTLYTKQNDESCLLLVFSELFQVFLLCGGKNEGI